jgi:uncharacterized protein YraI
MVSRSLVRAVIVAAALAFPALAEASPGWATGSVALRTGPSTAYARITVIPGGTRLQVYRCASWCEVVYGSFHGWAAGGYISTPRADFFSPVFVSPVETPSGNIRLKPVYVAPQPAYLASTARHLCDSWYPCGPPRPSWYDGKVFYHQGRWWDRPDVFIVVGR